MADRYAFDAAVRAATVQLLEDYRDDESLKLQVYRARPASVNPPTAFIDRMTERIDQTTQLFQRHPRAEVLVLHGLFDSGDAVDQRDRFVDGFFEWVLDRFHAAGANTTLALVGVEDVPVYVDDWRPPAQQRSYFATRLTLEGFAGGA
jgi:hypothetical protein